MVVVAVVERDLELFPVFINADNINDVVHNGHGFGRELLNEVTRQLDWVLQGVVDLSVLWRIRRDKFVSTVANDSSSASSSQLYVHASKHTFKHLP